MVDPMRLSPTHFRTARAIFRFPAKVSLRKYCRTTPAAAGIKDSSSSCLQAKRCWLRITSIPLLESVRFEQVTPFSFTANTSGIIKAAFCTGRIEIHEALTWPVGCGTKAKSISDWLGSEKPRSGRASPTSSDAALKNRGRRCPAACCLYPPALCAIRLRAAHHAAREHRLP